MTTTTRWQKAKASNSHGGNCVQIAANGTHVYIRDSKRPDAGALKVTPPRFAEFLADLEPAATRDSSRHGDGHQADNASASVGYGLSAAKGTGQRQ